MVFGVERKWKEVEGRLWMGVLRRENGGERERKIDEQRERKSGGSN